MQPQHRISETPASLERFTNTLKANVLAARQRRQAQVALPQVVGIKLTNRCNLRCGHCYQWNEDGYHRDFTQEQQSEELDLSVFKRILEETRSVKSRLYLWGGEPLYHRCTADILDLLKEDTRDTTICTNAYFVERYIEKLCAISENLELLIAVEGFEEHHDALRGKGSYRKVMTQLNTLLKLRKDGIYKGKISIHTVLSDGMVGRLYELMEHYEQLGVDLVLLCFPWYIAEETSKEMDSFVRDRFSWLVPQEGRHTWDAFKYRISPLYIDTMISAFERINARCWSTRIRYQPELEPDEIEAFVRGKAMIARCATSCAVLDTRIDVTPNGDVNACKFFSEFNAGNLRQSTLTEIWTSDQYNRIRGVLGQTLSPACSKCNTLYLQEHSIPDHI